MRLVAPECSNGCACGRWHLRIVSPALRSDCWGHWHPGEFDATTGVLASTIQLLADDATHVGVASDHTIESFRNELFNGYKDGWYAARTRHADSSHGRCSWSFGSNGLPMIEFEADDALASAAAANADDRVGQVLIVTPDKDLGQCVVGDRVVQFDRRKGLFIDESGVNEKFGVGPASIADWLALVGDTADGIPGCPVGVPKAHHLCFPLRSR